MEAIQRLEGLIAKLDQNISAEVKQQTQILADIRAHALAEEDDALNAVADKLEASVNRVAQIVPDVQAQAPPSSTPPATVTADPAPTTGTTDPGTTDPSTSGTPTQ